VDPIRSNLNVGNGLRKTTIRRQTCGDRHGLYLRTRENMFMLFRTSFCIKKNTQLVRISSTDSFMDVPPLDLPFLLMIGLTFVVRRLSPSFI